MRNSARKVADSLSDKIVSKVLLPFRNLAKNDKRYTHIADVVALNKLNRDEIVAHQLGRIKKILSEARQNSAFYARRIKAAGIHDIERLSLEEFARIKPLTKDDLREQQQEIINRRFEVSKLVESRTGGTTAVPVPIYLDKNSLNRRESATAAFNEWFGFSPGNRIAYLWAALQDLPSRSSWKARLQNRFIDRRLFLPTNVLDDRILASFCQQLRDFRPALLQAYPNPLEVLADYVLQNHGQIPLSAISTTAEALSADQRAKIKKAFRCDPFAWYGAREAGRIATQCHVREGMHINCYGLYVEVLEDSKYVSKNSGKILITDLWNEGMPIIRYSIGDVGEFDTGICDCGNELPRLRAVLGRTTDVFLNSKRQKIPGIVLLDSIHGDPDDIRQLQILQHDIGKFEAYIVPGAHFNKPTSTDRLCERLSDYIGDSVQLNTRIVDQLPREPSGKLRTSKNMMADI